MQRLKSDDSVMTVFYSRTETLGKKFRPLFANLLSLPDVSALMYHGTAEDRTGTALSCG